MSLGAEVAGMRYRVYRGGGVEGLAVSLAGIKGRQGAVPSGNTVPPSLVALSLQLRRSTVLGLCFNSQQTRNVPSCSKSVFYNKVK